MTSRKNKKKKNNTTTPKINTLQALLLSKDKNKETDSELLPCLKVAITDIGMQQVKMTVKENNVDIENIDCNSEKEFQFDNINGDTRLRDLERYDIESFKDDLKVKIDKIQDTILNCKVANLIIEYRKYRELNLTVENLNLIKNATVREIKDILSEVPLKDIEKCGLLSFFDWLDFNYERFYNRLCEDIKPAHMTVLCNRVQGKSLNTVGEVLGVTRERIRQIEQKALKKIKANWKHLIIYDINPIVVAAIINQSEYISRKDAEYYLGHKLANLIFWLIGKNIICTEAWVYNKKYDVISKNVDMNIIAKIEQSLPEKIEKENLYRYIDSKIPEVKYLPVGFMSKILDTIYNVQGQILVKGKNTLKMQCKYILENYFEEGITYTNKKDITKFVGLLKSSFNTDVSNSNVSRIVAMHVAEIGILAGPSTYMPLTRFDNNTVKNCIRRICKYINDDRHITFLYNGLYEKFKKELTELGIYNRYLLHGLMSFYRNEFDNVYYCRRDYVTKDPDATFSSELISYVRDNEIVHVSDIIKEFIGLKKYSINVIIQQNTELVSMGSGYITHIADIHIPESTSREILNELTKIVNKELCHKDDIFTYFQQRFPALLHDYRLKSSDMLYHFLKIVFESEFEFTGSHIAQKGMLYKSRKDLIHDYVYNADEIRISEISQMVRKHRVQITSILEYLNMCNDKFLIANDEKLVSIDKCMVTDSVINQIEERIVNNIDKTTPIYELSCLPDLPKIGVPWSDWLLYSIIKKWCNRLDVGATSRQFRYAVPLVAPKGKLNCMEYANLRKNESYKFVTMSNLSDTEDDLFMSWDIEEFIDNEF